MSLAEKFKDAIDVAHARLIALPESVASQPYRPGGWTRKQVLGHLVDSCVNNHVRIVRCVLEKGYKGPRYEQEKWVAIHGYDASPWADLVTIWRAHNRVLASVIERIPQEAFAFHVEVIDDGAMDLHGWVLDYLSHMEHHVADILGASKVATAG